MLGIDLRPNMLSKVIGQKNTIKTVNNLLKNNKYPTCSVFLGASGNGKSTTARIVAKTLNCENPHVDENGFIEPCCNCTSCKDIEKERYQLSVTSYNGVDLSIDKIREIEEELKYEPSFGSKNHIIIIEEAQMIPSTAFRSLLTLIEHDYRDTYFIMTSTDKSKFSGNSWASDNKSQEKTALKSRISVFNIKPTSTTEIEEYLFSILCKIDPDEKLPNTIEDLITFIAQSSHGNIRDAVNVFGQCIDGECYTREEAIDVLGLEDEEKEYEIVTKLAYKDKSAITYIQKSESIQGNFVYWNKILSDIAIRDMSGVPFNESWKEESAQKLIKSGNVLQLMNCFSRISSMCGAYWNDTIFISNIYEYMNDNKITNTPTVKKLKVIKG